MERLTGLPHGPNGLLILDTMLSPTELLRSRLLALCVRRARAEGIYSSNLQPAEGADSEHCFT